MKNSTFITFQPCGISSSFTFLESPSLSINLGAEPKVKLQNQMDNEFGNLKRDLWQDYT